MCRCMCPHVDRAHLAGVAGVRLAQHCVAKARYHPATLQGVLDVLGQLLLGGVRPHLQAEVTAAAAELGDERHEVLNHLVIISHQPSVIRLHLHTPLGQEARPPLNILRPRPYDIQRLSPAAIHHAITHTLTRPAPTWPHKTPHNSLFLNLPDPT